MWTRRQFVTRSGLALLGAGGACLAGAAGDAPPAPADDARDALPDGSASKDMITSQADDAIGRGLSWLAARRHRVGSFGTREHGYEGNVAITSLAGLAFMAAGNQPSRGPYGRVVLDALRFVLSCENKRGGEPGFLHNPDGTPHGPMYGHGFGTLFLAEVYGMAHDKGVREEVREKLHLAVQLILKSQNGDGGWRYEPHSTDADISVTICQIMALRSARNAGVAVPKSKVTRCVDYVMACQDRRGGWFRYQKNGGFGPAEGFARTAAGVVALFSAGYYLNMDVGQIKDDEEKKRARDAVEGIKAGLKYLMDHKPNGGGLPVNRLDMLHYFYGHYYAVQAMWTAGGAYWKEWFPAVRDELLTRQLPDGSWVDGIDPHYATAMASIILQVPNNYLPILQK
jgi:hypothetical protein